MKRKVILALISLFMLGACTNNENSSNSSSDVLSVPITNSTSQNVSNLLPLEARVFIDSVNNWIDDELTIEHKDLIDSAYFIYDSLSDESKQLEEVIIIKRKLDEVKDEFMIMYHQYLLQKDDEESGYAFAEKVNSIGDAQTLLLDDEILVNQLNLMYESLSESAKTLQVVTKAKEVLDEINDFMAQLKSMSEEDYVAYEFVVKVNLLPSVNELSFNQIDLVNEIKNKYDELDINIQNKQEVKDAFELLTALLNRVDEMLVVREHAEAFIDAVYRLPTFDKLKWKDNSQDAQIKDCEDSYAKLTLEEKEYPGVSGAYNELVATRQTFDNLKEPFDISKFGFSISLGGWNNQTNNYDLRVMFASGKDPISVLTGYYNLPKDSLSDYVTVYLNMYREAGAVKSNPLYRFDITKDYNLTLNDFLSALRELKAQGNEKAVSGEGYNFTINVESKFDGYASSDYSGFSVGARINF